MPELDTFTIDIIKTGVYAKNPVPVFPKGTFKIQTVRTDFYFRNVLDGVMTFQGADFDLIYNEDPCVEFLIKCDFTRNGSGLIWEGVFTKTDCRINTSKKYIEVTPAPYDDYRNFLPYLQVPVNVLPSVAYGGETFGPDTLVRQIRSYRKETRTVEIKEPYTGPNSESWVGYSVNDWVGGAETDYTYINGKRNSLIWYLTDNKTFGTISDIQNQRLWIDYEGYESKFLETSVYDFSKAIDNGNQYTLSEVVNYYNQESEWQRCELIYEREVWEGESSPPSGNKYIDISSYPNILGPVGWFYLDGEDKWVRRALNMCDDYVPTSVAFTDRPTISGDGTWYTTLSDEIEIADGFIRKQVLYRNRKWEELYGISWHNKLYGTATVRDRYHRIPTIISKFLVAIKNKGGDYFPLESDFLESEISPIKNIPNDWYNTLIIQNSDFKRPESSEKATKQEFTFREFLDSFCSLTNTGWALIDGKFRLEHTSFFDNGLTYTPNFNDPAQFINPLSLQNAAKSKGYLNMSNDYRYEQKEMQRFEIFSTDGGQENDFHRAEIEYDTPCANNYPDENTLEYDINGLTVDPEWVLREGGDAGMLLVKAVGSAAPDIVTQRKYRVKFSDYGDFTSDGTIGFYLYSTSLNEVASLYFDRTDFGLSGFLEDLDAFVTANTSVAFSNGQTVTLTLIAPDIIEFSGGSSLVYNAYTLDGVEYSALIGLEYQSESELWVDAITPYVFGGSVSSGDYFFEILHSQDEHGRYRLNSNFSLDYILKVYHTYRRSFKKGDINKTLYQFISRPYVIHNLWFPYRLDLEPYKRVLTELGYGIIRSADFNCKDGVTEMVVGYQERGYYSFEEAPEEEIIPLDDYYDDTPTFDDPVIELPSFTLAFYVHRQDIPSSKWQVNHKLGTYFFMRPIVWTLESSEIIDAEYQWGYGYLYNWWVTQEEVTSSNDWSVPLNTTWTTLLNYLIAIGHPNSNILSGAGNALKGCRQVSSPLVGYCDTSVHPRWNYNATHYGTGLLKFEGYPSGYRMSTGSFIGLGSNGYLWANTVYNSLNSYYRQIPGSRGDFLGSFINNASGLAVRLVRVATTAEQLLDDGTYCDDYIGNDGKRYKTVKIGTQVWLAANLAETKYRNGDLIPFEAVPGQGNYSNAQWAALTTPARCAYSNNETYVSYESPYDEELTETVYPEEIDYESLRVTGLGTAELTFTDDVAGEAYFLTLVEPTDEEDVDLPLYTHEQTVASDTWIVNHNLGTEDIIFSVVLREDGSVTSLSNPKYVEVGYDDFEIVDENTAKVYFSAPITGRISIATFDVNTTVADIDDDEYSVEMSRHILKPLVLRMGKEIGYDYAKMEDTLLKLGFTKPVIARIIVKKYD